MFVVFRKFSYIFEDFRRFSKFFVDFLLLLVLLDVHLLQDLVKLLRKSMIGCFGDLTSFASFGSFRPESIFMMFWYLENSFWTTSFRISFIASSY